MGTVVFGPAEIYKEISVRIAKARAVTDRAFKLELGNNEESVLPSRVAFSFGYAQLVKKHYEGNLRYET